MTFQAQMRVGTLEITAALLLVAIVAARPRVRAAAEIGRMQPMRVALEVVEFDRRRDYEGRPPFEVGRGRELDLVLRDPEVSRRHARFESQNGVVYVEDLHSRNGTFLNGRRVGEAIEVRDGDAVDVGATRLLVQSIRPWT
ncbi:MAG: FHA domain-containing protein [Candidatus Tumulicola sp.]